MPGPSLNEMREAGVEHILQPYLAGEPFFTKDILDKTERYITENKNNKLLLPDDSYYIMAGYNNAQSLVSDVLIRGTSANWMRCQRPVPLSERETREFYQSSREEWLDSQDFLSFKAKWNPIMFDSSINKIVCFGLGAISNPDEPSRRRSNIQHAAVKSIMEFWKQRNGGEDIRCYAQDPAYVDSDKEVLKSIGIETIEDPKGFFEVDEKTLVVSVSPNAPVRQIVADLQSPGAMLWDTVKSIEIEHELWKETLKGRCPTWSTDPDSPRLQKLVENYVEHRLQDGLQAFGDVALYIKK